MASVACAQDMVRATDPADRVNITGVAPEESILPTARPLTSVYGTEQNIVNIPRDVSTITKEQVDFRQITSVNQLDQFASGVYSASIFGAEGLPQIRGVPAEIYQNGQRQHYYFSSFPPSFNGTESIDVVKGPGTAVYGPASHGLGGYVNLVTKLPFFDGQHTEITTVLGDFVEGGGSHGRYQWQVDNSGPLVPGKLAYRVSYLGREADSYYRNVVDNVQDVFAALTFLPTERLRLDLTSQFYESRFNEDAGFNRVTQDLIDNHRYIAGPFLPSYAPFVGVVDPGPDGSYADQTVNLHHSQVLVSPSDSAAGSRYLGQLIATLTLDGVTIKNSTYGESTESRKQSAYGYTEYAPSNIVFENRTEFQFAVNTGSVRHHFDAGLSVRAEHTRSYAAFFNEPFSVYDLSGSGPTPTFSRLTLFGPERTIPGKAGYYASAGSGQATVVDYEQGGVFLQDDVEFAPWLSGVFGLRCDIIAAQSGAPGLGPVLVPTQDYQEPSNIDPTRPLAATRRDTTLIANESYFASLVYKPRAGLSLYLTYDRVNGTDSVNNQGALPLVRADNDYLRTRVAASSLRALSELYEGGAKTSLFHDTLFASVAAYHQTRSQLQPRGGGETAVVARGVDVDFAWQPRRWFSVTSNFTWQAANYRASTPFSQTGNYLDIFAAGVNVDGNPGTGAGSPNYISLPKGDYRLPDVPNILFNAYAVGELPCGLGLGIGPQVTGDVNVNTQGTLVIPAQVTWNGFLYYRQKNYELRLSFFNILDARNWTPPSTFANNDLIYPDEPFHMNATVKVRF